MTTQKTLGRIASETSWRTSSVNSSGSAEINWDAVAMAVEAEVLARQAAQPAPQQIAQPVQPADKDVILEALQAYQCTEHVDEDGDGARLVDVLTHGGTIAAGLSEIEALTDYIWGAISDAAKIAGRPVPPAVPVATVTGCCLRCAARTNYRNTLTASRAAQPKEKP